VANRPFDPPSGKRLLGAVLTIGEDLALAPMLHRLVETAVELVDAEYGALGVLDESRRGLAEFITVGIDDATRGAIGDVPKGLGILGALITDARPLRLAHINDYPDRAGFPPHHPNMTSFLGVPVRTSHGVFGNLYLTNKRSGPEFTETDEELVTGLAAMAGVAIDNARLFEDSQRRERTLTAMQDVANALLAGAETDETLQIVARDARELVNADIATIALPNATGTTMTIEVADGAEASDVLGRRFARAGSISGDALTSGKTEIILETFNDPRTDQPQVKDGHIGASVFIPLLIGSEPFGTLAVARDRGRPAFSAADVEILESFASQASVVLDNEQGRQQLQRLSLVEERERIARDLHDTVIQRLFATGLSLQATTKMIGEETARDRVKAAVADLDETVRHIRTVIFEVERRGPAHTEELRARVLDLVVEAGRPLGFDPHVRFAGVIDATVPKRVGDELLATLREALSNVARHARATAVDVDLRVDDHIRLQVIDNGVGLPPGVTADTGRLGIPNMRARAQRLGGILRLSAADQGTTSTGTMSTGTMLEWEVPLEPE
jgi:signal transduction histidine kinase